MAQKQTFQDIIRSKSKDLDMSFRRGFDQFEEPKDDSSPNENTTSRYALWCIALASVIFLFFVLSYFFSGATVVVVPKSEIAQLEDIEFSAMKATTTDDLRFEIMTVRGEETRTVEATSESAESTKASGRIVIFNNSGKTAQKLVATTRFQTPDGKIYRIADEVTVPGQKTENGKTVPGSVEVAVYADQPGESYNIPLSDFTIPGFAGSAKFETIYARGKTPMSGGSTGKVYVVSEEEANIIRTELSEVLYQKLTSQAQAELPEGYVFFPGATFSKNNEVSVGAVVGKEKDVVVRQSSSLSVIIFEKNSLIKEIAQKSIREYDSLPISMPSLESLVMNLKNHDNIVLNDVEKIAFTFSGAADIVWTFDEEQLTQELSGRKKKDFQSILSNYTSIEKASFSISPFWKNTFPDKKEKIKIDIDMS